MRRGIVLLSLLASAQGYNGGGAGPCEGKRLDGPAKDVLRGAHLTVLELEWAPFAYKDATASHGWSGFDIDLFSEVANILGFTFEVTETSKLTDETYTQFLVRTVDTTLTPTLTREPEPESLPLPLTRWTQLTCGSHTGYATRSAWMARRCSPATWTRRVCLSRLRRSTTTWSKWPGSQQPTRPPTAPEADPLAQGRALGPNVEPSPRGCQREPLRRFWCLPNVAHLAAFGHPGTSQRASRITCSRSSPRSTSRCGRASWP